MASAPGAGALRDTLDGAGFDLLRLPMLDFAPRGLILIVGCVGVLLGLCDDLPGWDGCQKMLKGQALKRKAGIPLRRPTRAERNGQCGVPAGSFWQQLERFDAAAVTAAQRETVLSAMSADVGGLMAPEHLEQVSRGAAALGRWLQVVNAIMRATRPALPEAEGEAGGAAAAAAGAMTVASFATAAATAPSLFEAPELEWCPICAVRLERAAVAEHVALCRARAAERAAEHADAGATRDALTRHLGSQLSPLERARIASLASERVQRLGGALLAPWAPSPRHVPTTAPAPALEPAPRVSSPPPAAAAPPPASGEPRAPSPEAAAPSAETAEGGYEYLKARTGWAGAGWAASRPPAHYQPRVQAKAEQLAAQLGRPRSPRRPSSPRHAPLLPAEPRPMSDRRTRRLTAADSERVVPSSTAPAHPTGFAAATRVRTPRAT